MLEKFIFLLQVYFVISTTATLILFAIRLPKEFEMAKRYKLKRRWRDNLSLFMTFITLFVGFPIIAMYYGIKEF